MTGFARIGTSWFKLCNKSFITYLYTMSGGDCYCVLERQQGVAKLKLSEILSEKCYSLMTS